MREGGAELLLLDRIVGLGVEAGRVVAAGGRTTNVAALRAWPAQKNARDHARGLARLRRLDASLPTGRPLMRLTRA